jgi:hypothetical protein
MSLGILGDDTKCFVERWIGIYTLRLESSTTKGSWIEPRMYHLKKIRENLLAAQEDLEHPRDWRPCVLAVARETEARKKLLNLGAWFEGGSGFTAALTVVEGRGPRMGRLGYPLKAGYFQGFLCG